jgi:Phage capsid protein
MGAVSHRRTQRHGAAVEGGEDGPMSKTVANQIATKLRNAHVGEDDRGNIFAAVSPAVWAYLTDITSFSNSLYTDKKRVDDGIPQIGNQAYWMGVNWMEHTLLPGLGTSACTCYAWHKAAVGHAIASGTVDAVIDRMREQDYSFARHTVYHGALKIQNAGIVKFIHDDSALS